MSLSLIQEKDLIVKKSTLPVAGKGLFTKVEIRKGTIIAEYKGKITSWEEADHKNGRNRYIYYVNKNHVINANDEKNTPARFANDADGTVKLKGISNNSSYIEKGKRVFIQAFKKIPAGSEILVGYGKEYWKVTKKVNRK